MFANATFCVYSESPSNLYQRDNLLNFCNIGIKNPHVGGNVLFLQKKKYAITNKT